MNPKMKELREKAMKLPLEPGVYLMHNAKNEIIYIGKAKKLKNRVSQYFGSQNNHNEKTKRMVFNVDYFEYVITDSEFEALVLEASLIKQYKPKYNILLKDDKGYSYIKISNERYPRITEEKKPDDSGEFIGPYKSSYYVKTAVDQAVKIFKLPTCTRKFPEDFGKGRPCLNFHIKQCCGLCRGKISQEEYGEIISEATAFLKQGGTLSVKELEQEMLEASENLEFERAARIRDRIAAVKRMSDKQKVVAAEVKEQDVIALFSDGNDGCFQVFRFTNGTLFDRETFTIKELGDEDAAFSEFVLQYYTIRNRIPQNITIDRELEDKESLERWLTEKSGRRVYMFAPQKGERKHLVTMCKNNAAEVLAQSKNSQGRYYSALKELGELLGMKKVPSYIESYDISNLAGTENVAGMIVFENGRPLKSAYRKFKIKSFEGQDDFASMNEVLTRRFEEYRKLKDTNEGFGRLPDLILLDGGKGQISAVRPVLESMGIDVPLFGMVKDDKHKTRAITDGTGEIELKSFRSSYTLVSDIQEEVHRFAIGYHHQRRSRNAFKSSLTDIEGIGQTRAKNLLKYFGTIKNIREAELVELENAPSMNRNAAQAVYNYFHDTDKD
ncbi:MAG: excinuclease ABC subunit UvrC [Clostridia bacterium]|nr:excinuclease ABC subunit UvrC [Clostridia bacterium]MBQ2347061.1 excinuclease ABC subunit UvrC [Clostridia bacterium]